MFTKEANKTQDNNEGQPQDEKQAEKKDEEAKENKAEVPIFKDEGEQVESVKVEEIDYKEKENIGPSSGDTVLKIEG
jgi:hypothetical protein